MNETTIFFEEAFGELPADAWILVWTLPDKGSRFFRDHTQAAAYSTARAAEHDVYVGVGLRGRDHGGRRGGTGDVTGIVGFWADLDIADPAHKKPNLPPDEAAARRLLGAMPLRPTLTIHSGHGMQAWWLFTEPYLFDDATDRERVEQISAGWSDLLKTKASPHGWDVDSVWDLARVLRVPGTTNHKRLPVPVCLLSEDGPRYSGPRDFLDYVTLRPRQKVHVNGHTPKPGLNGDAVPPFGKFDALCENIAEFRAAWDRTARAQKDRSPSGWDMTLANYAARAGWTAEEITNLLIAARRKHGDDLQLGRVDYYALTVGKALASQEQEAAIASLSLLGAEGASGDESRAAILDYISRLLRVPIAGWMQHGRERARFTLRLADGRDVPVGTISTVYDADAFSRRVCEETQHTIPVIKKGPWREIVSALFKIVEVVENEEATRTFSAREWIAGYLASIGVARGDSERLGEAIAAGRPFVRDDHMHLHAPGLRKYVLLNVMEQIETADLHDALRALGFVQAKRSGRDRNGRVRSRSYWHAPEAVLVDRAEPVEVGAV